MNAPMSGLRGTLQLDEPMRRHTTWRVGGPAKCYYQPADVDDLAHFLGQLDPDEPLYWIGLGSNLLVRDGGIAGTVIAFQAGLAGWEAVDETAVRVEAGVPCPRVARESARAGLVGAEFLAGIPGTMGGALAMNAGAFGGETWSLVEQVETLDRWGTRRVRGPQDFRVGYRQVTGPKGEWFVAARLRLERGDAEGASARIRELLDQRSRTQPTQLPTAGSVFRNPPSDRAGRLIEAAGLKGFCIGGACVSEKHANFIVNAGNARATEIEALIEHIIETVRAQHGVTLVPEVHIVGEPEGEP